MRNIHWQGIYVGFGGYRAHIDTCTAVSMCMYIRKSSNSKINLTPQERVDCITLLSHCRLKEYVTQCAYDDGVGSLLVAIDVLDDLQGQRMRKGGKRSERKRTREKEMERDSEK